MIREVIHVAFYFILYTTLVAKFDHAASVVQYILKNENYGNNNRGSVFYIYKNL